MLPARTPIHSNGRRISDSRIYGAAMRLSTTSSPIDGASLRANATAISRCLSAASRKPRPARGLRYHFDGVARALFEADRASRHHSFRSVSNGSVQPFGPSPL